MFWLGTTFYPELWDDKYQERAFRLMKEIGFNIVRFGEVSWGAIETADNKTDFSFIDKALKIAKQNRLSVLLGVGVCQAPAWLVKKHPEITPKAHDGTMHPDMGPRPNACRDNASFKKYAQRFLYKMVARYKGNNAVAAWQVDNEPAYPPLDTTSNKDYCHCDASRGAFVSWLKNKYKKIDNLNKSLGTFFWSGNYSNFSDINTPKVGFWDAGNPHIYLEWMRFKSENMSNWLKELKKNVRKYDKKRPIGTNNFVGPCNRVLDNRTLADGMDWYGWDIYPKGTLNSPESLAEHADQWRSICNSSGADFIVAELQGGANVRWGHPGQVSGVEIRNWSHQITAHGAKGILYHALRSPLFGSETSGFGILELNGSSSSRVEGIKTFISEINKVWPHLSKYSLVPQVGIAYLRSSDIETYQEMGPSRDAPPRWINGRGDLGLVYALDSIAGAYRMLWKRQNPAGFIFEQDIENEKIDYKVILLPNPYLLSEKQAAILIKYVKNGGILITECRFGLKDQKAYLREHPVLEDLIGVVYSYTEMIEDKTALNKWGANAYGFRDIVSVQKKDARVVCSYADGNPALIEKRLGRGMVVCATFSLFTSLLKFENSVMLENLRENYIPSAEFKLKGGAMVEMVVWSGANPLLYLINHSDAAQKIVLEKPANYKTARDLLSGKIIDAKEGGFRLEFGSYGVKMLEILERGKK